MPIRINLLAEQQAAEEARRRDPVKRALWVGGALGALMVVWMLWLQVRLVSARAELARYEAQLQSVEQKSKLARANFSTNALLQSRIASLQRYSTNRFFCANLLDALQQVVVDDVRITQLQTVHSYSTNAESLITTNLAFPIHSRPAWKFWAAREPPPDLAAAVSNQIGALAAKLQSLSHPVDLVTKIEWRTNAQEITAAVQMKRPCTAAERIILIIKARDYASAPIKRVDEFSKAVATHSYFARRLHPGEGVGIRLRERAIQPEVEVVDSTGAERLFIPFAIECRYREQLRTYE